MNTNYSEKYFLIPLLENRVRRNYSGGAGIDILRGCKNNSKDSTKPEDWIASLVHAINPGLEPVENEGLSRCALAGGPFLADVIKTAPEFYLGADNYKNHGLDLGFLLKLLDSSMRLHVQAHPTRSFAKNKLGSPYGKFECYYILQAREKTQGYIRLGFQHPPSIEQWRGIIERQDITAMDACFEKIPVNAGEVWYIPGGSAHAIGENILMLEIMEPSDLVVRCEFEREGITVPQAARFMGHDLDFCLDIFDYTEQTIGDVLNKYRINPITLTANTNGVLYQRLISPPLAPFLVERVSFEFDAEFSVKNEKCGAAVVTRGKVIFTSCGMSVDLSQGKSLFIAASCEEIKLKASQNSEVCFVNGVN